MSWFKEKKAYKEIMHLSQVVSIVLSRNYPYGLTQAFSISNS
jgi:hypothetical protein